MNIRSVGMIGRNKEWGSMQGFDFGTWIEVNGQKVRAWPDNDGRLWYYDPETGEVRYTE